MAHLRIQYFSPRDDICDYVSSYYSVAFDEPLSDVMRAEIASVRFITSGGLVTDVSGEDEALSGKIALLCGPTHRATKVSFEKGFHVFGAAVTPLGWARMFDVDAFSLADRVVPFLPLVGAGQEQLVKRVLNAPDNQTRVTACNHLFASMVDHDRPINEDFLKVTTEWITDPANKDLDALLCRIDLSPRQVERLSKRYFGCGPKMLHRKFRALDSANRLTWENLTDWRKAAGDHYHDQPHFIREFKHFIGRTPTEFIKSRDLLVRATLEERLNIEHQSPLSLIG